MMKRIIHIIKQFDLMISVFKPALRLYVFVVLGIAIGMLTVYILAPVKFRNNAAPVQLDDAYRDQWIKDTANAYQYVTQAAQTLDPESRSELEIRAQAEVTRKLVDAGITTADIDRLKNENPNESYLLVSLDTIRPFANDSAAQKQLDDHADPGFFTNVIAPILIYIGVIIAGVLVVVYYKLFGIPFLRPLKRVLGLEKIDPRMEAELKRRDAVKEDAKKKTEFVDVPPVTQFISTYLAGDNYYDDSFAIELEDGTFLGECGSGISDTIGVGDPKKVTATEVWMFDKNDISTITYVLMSEHAYHDEAIRAKLAPRGEAILAREGSVTELETQTLRAEIRVKSLEYGAGSALPPNSYFDRLTVEIAVWQKEGAAPIAGKASPDMMDFPTPEPAAYMPPVQPMPPQQRPPMPPPQQPMAPQTAPGQPMPPQQRPPMPPPQQPMAPQAAPSQPMPPQQRPPMPPPQQPMAPQRAPGQPMPPQQRPPMPPPQQPRAPQGGPGQPMPPQQRPPMPPPQPGQQQRPPSPFGDTGEMDM